MLTDITMRADIPSAKLWVSLDRGAILMQIAAAGRICSAGGLPGTGNEAVGFVRKLMARGHESVIEHVHVSFVVTCSRACSHQLVRHRLCSFSQESQRYVSYGEGNPPEFYIPPSLGPVHRKHLEVSYGLAAAAYAQALDMGLKPQAARLLLPNGTLTRLMMTANLRQWKHMIKLRTDEAADEEIRALFLKIQNVFQTKLPEIF
jgi:thymidylate synthase (FAD)